MNVSPLREVPCSTSQVPNAGEHVSAALEAIKLRSFDSVTRYLPINSDTTVLTAFKEGAISLEEFCTKLALDSFSDEKVYEQPIFDEMGKLDPAAKEMLLQTFESKGSINAGLPPILDAVGFEKFIELMRKVSPSERVIHYTSKIPSLEGVSGDISQRLGMNVFHRFNLNEIEYRMIPTFSMMQNFLFAFAGENAVTITPVIGLSTLEDIIKNGKSASRDMALPFPGVGLPKMADGLAVDDYVDFMFHDFYHAVLASGVPDKYRQGSIEFAKFFQAYQSHPYFRDFYEKLIDMEYHDFRKDAQNLVPVEDPTDLQRFIWYVASKQADAYQGCLVRGRDTVAKNVQIIAAEILQSGFCEKFGISAKEIQILLDASQKEFIAKCGETRAKLILANFRKFDIWSAVKDGLTRKNS